MYEEIQTALHGAEFRSRVVVRPSTAAAATTAPAPAPAQPDVVVVEAEAMEGDDPQFEAMMAQSLGDVAVVPENEAVPLLDLAAERDEGDGSGVLPDGVTPASAAVLGVGVGEAQLVQR